MDKLLKQRLIGASILIALGVIFLPMLFDRGSSSRDTGEHMVELPERNAGETRVRRLSLEPDASRQPTRPAQERTEPLDEPVDHALHDIDVLDNTITEPDAGGERPDADEALADAAAQQEESENPVDEAEPVVEPEELEIVADETLPEAEPSPGQSPEADEPADPQGRWVVQVAVFSSSKTAESISQRLEALGHATMQDVLVRDQAQLHRLRTGPYGDREAAERVRKQIATTIKGIEPAVRELSSENRSGDRSGLTVQVGSFASHKNAEQLVGKLSDAGYDSFMHGEQSGQRTIWRVRAGLYDSRTAAEELLARLRTEQGLDGIVVSHP